MSKLFDKISSDGLQQKYKVVLPAIEVENAMLESTKKYATGFKLHGFRPGHVPLSIVRKRMNKEITQEALDNLISKTYNEIIKEANIKEFATRPTYKFNSPFVEGKDIDITMTIESAPEFELKPFNFEVIKIIPKVTKEEIEERRSAIMKNSPLYEDVEKNHSINVTDKVSYKAEYFEKTLRNKSKDISNIIVIPEQLDNNEFAQNFLGKTVDDSFTFQPKNTGGNYLITIKHIQKEIKNISADDYAMKVGFKNLEEFDDKIKSQITNEIESRAHLYYKSQIVEELIKEYNFELPKSIVERETKTILAQIRHEEKASIKEGEKEKTDEELENEYGDTIKKRVLLGYIFNKIANQEKIVATDDELNAVILSEVNANPANAQNIIQFYKNTPVALIYKRAEITEHKVISFLMSKVKIKEEEKTLKEIIELVNKLMEDEGEN